VSWITDIAVPIGVGFLALCIIFLAKGFLSFNIGVAVWVIAMAVVIVLTVLFIPVNMLLGFFRYGREGFTFMQARKDGKPVLVDVEIGSNNAEFVVGDKENPKDPLFKDEASGVKVDPSLVSAYAEPLRFPGGLEIYGYAYHNWLPQTTRNHLAFKAIIEYFHNEPKMHELNFLMEKEFIELISKPEHFLESDLRTKVGKYFKKKAGDAGAITYYRQFEKDGKWYEQEISMPKIIELIHQAKADITKLPIATGYFSMNEAFKYNNVSYSAQHLSQLKSLLQQLMFDKMSSLVNWMQYGTIIMGILGILVLGIYVLASTVFKGG
jgi:hypothetical protein